MQDNKTSNEAAPAADPGFKVPGAGGLDQSSTTAGAASAPAVVDVAGAPASDTSGRDLAIGSGIFVVLIVVFFFARSAFTQHLVVRRVAPSAAGSAGWLLYVALMFLSAAAVLAIINPGKFLSVAITAPLLIVGVGAMVAALLVGRR